VIAKTTRNASGLDLVRHLFGPGDAAQHSGPHVVANDLGVFVAQGEALSRADVVDLGRAVELPRVLFGTQVTGGHIWHLALANHADDRLLTDDEWAGVARTVVSEMGLEACLDEPACPWVAVRHGLTSDGRDHVHVVVSLVRTDGTTASVWNDWVKVSFVCAKAERSLGLRVLRHVHRRPA
jgi:hypothetical protein